MLGEHFTLYDDEEIWEKIDQKKGGGEETTMFLPGDLKQQNGRCSATPPMLLAQAISS